MMINTKLSILARSAGYVAFTLSPGGWQRVPFMSLPEAVRSSENIAYCTRAIRTLEAKQAGWCNLQGDFVRGLSRKIGADALLGDADDDRIYADGPAYEEANLSVIYALPEQHGADFVDGGDGNDILLGQGNDESISMRRTRCTARVLMTSCVSAPRRRARGRARHLSTREVE